MKLKKPKFWDYKNPNIFAYLLLPFSFITILINYFKKYFFIKDRITNNKIYSICVGNIYIGGTGKTPISIEIKKILNNLHFKTAFIKKDYSNQIDEQKLLSYNGKLFCEKKRTTALKKAIEENIDVAIFDDGLQDNNFSNIYNLSFVCFNIENWVGNGLLLPAGPLRENLKSIKMNDAVFLNGNGEDTLNIQNIIKNINPNIKIFYSKYIPLDLEKFNLEQNYLAFSGIGNPNSFLKTLKKNKFKIIKNLCFPDHYEYSERDIIKIKKTAKNINAKIITTEKDYNRLKKIDSKNIEYLKIRLKIINENQLINFLKEKI
ncbi:tetraacyldisaccharide 4'-kinase [Candidatus Pelagibacter sp.]|nr:tetraacyldisaccharide 4'-kinase [Candidatus Pelagibacter sp.]